MKHNFPKLRWMISLLIGIILLAVPLTRRYMALQLGLLPNDAAQTVAIVFTRSQSDDPLEKDFWKKLLDKVQFNEASNYADKYLFQHPEQISLLTERARYLIGNSRLPERAGELGSVASPGAPLSDRDDQYEKERKAKSKVLLQRVRKLCLLGRKQEPQNSYYDLLLSIVAYSQYPTMTAGTICKAPSRNRTSIRIIWICKRWQRIMPNVFWDGLCCGKKNTRNMAQYCCGI